MLFQEDQILKKKIFVFVLTAVTAIGLSGTMLTPAQAKTATNEQIVFDFLTDNIGLNSAAACGIMANIEAESGFNPGEEGDKQNGVYTSYGICQWHASRKTDLQEWCEENNRDYTTITGQLYYLKHELSTNNEFCNGKTIYTYIANKENVPNTADGAYEAGRYWCIKYEVPANKEKKSVERGEIARTTYWPTYGNGKKSGSNSAVSDVTDPSINIKNAVYPESVKVGTSFTIDGTISSELKLTKVHAACYDMNGKVKTEASFKPGTYSYKLADSSVDNGLLISKLEPGKYRYVLEASNASKDTVLLEKTFTVVPKGTSVKSLKAGKKQFTVTWKKQSSHTDGYQLQYATEKSFKNAKTVTVKKTSSLQKTVTGLKSKEKYYVRVRTYANYSEDSKTERMPSSWSEEDAVTVK